MKESLKIRVNDSDRQEVIDLLGSLGKSFCWDVKTRWSEVAHIFVYQPAKNLERGNDDGYFDNHVNKEITLPELRELAKPREYLNDKFELVVTNQPQDGFILVPDGAYCYAQQMADDNAISFYAEKIDFLIFLACDGTWTKSSSKSYEELHKILWQRENKVETAKGRFLHQWAYEAFGRGEELEFLSGHPQDGWKEFIPHIYVTAAFDDKKWQFRLKPQTIQIGSRTIIKPISVKPEIGTEIYASDTVQLCKYYRFKWSDDYEDYDLLNRNICHLTAVDAINMTDALLELMK